MNYTYIPSSQYSSRPVIVMTSNPSSKKTNNMIENPSVSLLVHDCKMRLPLLENSLASQPQYHEEKRTLTMLPSN